MFNEEGIVELNYDYAIIMMKIIEEENGMYNAIKNEYDVREFEDEVYVMEIKNKYIEKNMNDFPIASIIFLLFHHTKLFDNGTIYICCNPEQAEDIRGFIKDNRDRLGEFELKVIVGTNIIKFI